MQPTVFGLNIGHGYVKAVTLDDAQTATAFPAMLAEAQPAVAGSLASIPRVQHNGHYYWEGEHALHSRSPITAVTSDRLNDPVFLPVMVHGAINRLREQAEREERMLDLHGALCVTGLPATWASDRPRAQALGSRIREACPTLRSIRVIAEPLGVIYAEAINEAGEIIDQDLTRETVAIVDIGHKTVDVCVVRNLMPLPESLQTYELGTLAALNKARSLLSAWAESELSLFETDQALRQNGLRLAGQMETLPERAHLPMAELGTQIATRLEEAWGRGMRISRILIGGGGGEVSSLVAPIQARFRQAAAVATPQLSIATGYARFARHLQRGER